MSELQEPQFDHQVVFLHSMNEVVRDASYLHSLLQREDGLAPLILIDGWIEDIAATERTASQINAALIVARGIAESDHPIGYAHEAITTWMRRNKPFLLSV